jgi:hypothetical protein
MSVPLLLVGLRGELGVLRADLTSLRGDLALVERRLLTRLGALIVVLGGVLFAALRHWP